MNFLEKLIALSDSEEGALLEFYLQYKFDNDLMHYFFEGYEDPAFYNPIIQSILSYSFHSYNSKGKYKIYEIYDDINWNKFSKNRVLFFTDRDYSELIGEELKSDENIYVTDYYSIENHVVNNSTIEKVLRELFHITNNDQISNIISKFEEEYNRFFNGSLYVYAWIIFMRREKIKIHLDDLNFGKLFDISVDSLSFKTIGGMNYSYLENVTNSITPLNSENAIKEIIKEIRSFNSKLIIRGKFEIWFLVRYLTRLKEGLANQKFKFKLNTHLNEGNCIEILGGKIDPPESLVDFLRSARQRLIIT